jgi:hypothetical protein
MLVSKQSFHNKLGCCNEQKTWSETARISRNISGKAI